VKRILQVCPQATQIKNNQGETVQQMAIENWKLTSNFLDDEKWELLPEIQAAFEDAKVRAEIHCVSTSRAGSP
jgi:alkylhydroperoxidase family enzyme